MLTINSISCQWTPIKHLTGLLRVPVLNRTTTMQKTFFLNLCFRKLEWKKKRPPGNINLAVATRSQGFIRTVAGTSDPVAGLGKSSRLPQRWQSARRIRSFVPSRQQEFWVISALVYLAQFWLCVLGEPMRAQLLHGSLAGPPRLMPIGCCFFFQESRPLICWEEGWRDLHARGCFFSFFSLFFSHFEL